jgi:hypothetical protein
LGGRFRASHDPHHAVLRPVTRTALDFPRSSTTDMQAFVIGGVDLKTITQSDGYKH